ncbi:MAG: chemotaxis response regulator protein-glutamate methylesterase [Proteobacteria bacterium]|nr:chemotaxis response regulator protein-glutamate methylesterase [Pseudomonadota bacterium]
MVYKVLVVDDSAFMRSELTKIIQWDPGLEVVATARNGSQVLERIRKFRPHVVTMDINMPIMDGIEALDLIMREAPLPVIMISALTRDGAEKTMDALDKGAFDFFHKPSGAISLDIAAQGETIRTKIKTAAYHRDRIALFGNAAGRDQRMPQHPTPQSAAPRPLETIGDKAVSAPHRRIVGIGVSTGGPRILKSVLSKMPADLKGSILVAQHMPEKFTSSFAKRLDSLCRMRVREAKTGDLIEIGTIYIAPGGKQMRVRRLDGVAFSIETEDDVPSRLFKPSVEVLFESLLSSLGNKWLGVMLTGMGSDGAKALTRLRRIGGHTIAESKESCVVYGMPRKVIEMGGAEFILQDHEIAEKIIDIVGRSECG